MRALGYRVGIAILVLGLALGLVSDGTLAAMPPARPTVTLER